MISQKLVPPAEIESELLKIWENLGKMNKTRASLFNLIVFSTLSERANYIRSIVQKLVDTFPCRILFVSHDKDSTNNYLKTAVSVVAPEGESAIACDAIDIGVAGSDWERVPYVILPHILPDLPVYLLWSEDPSVPHPLFESLCSLTTRIIFDSEAADNLLEFSQRLLFLHDKERLEVADLNWARLESWRDLFATVFSDQDLLQIKSVHIVYNSYQSPNFCHVKIQALYLIGLLASRLNWSFQKAENPLNFLFKEAVIRVDDAPWEELAPGCILSVEIATHQNKQFRFTRKKSAPYLATVQIETEDRCEIPFDFVMKKAAVGQSLSREIFLKGTNPFFLDTLRQTLLLDQIKLC